MSNLTDENSTAPATEGPDPVAPPKIETKRSASEQYMERWLKDRELERSWGVFKPLDVGFIEGVSGFVIYTYDEEGVLRPELSRTRYDRQKDKYISKDGVGSVAFAPRPNSFALFDSAKEKWIAEGEGKALALSGLGLPVLGVGGCHNWHLSEDNKILPSIASRIHKGDIVNVAMDGDWQTNPNVAKGTGPLLHELIRLGATPRLKTLPPNEGVDDHIAILRRGGMKDREIIDHLTKLPHLRTIPIPGDVPVVAYREVIARPPPEWIIEGLIQPGELTSIVGPTSCGKTFLTMDMLFAVTRGLPYWQEERFYINRRGAVVHITLEGTSLTNRLNAYRIHHSLTDDIPYFFVEVPVNLREEAITDSIIRSITHAAQGQSVVLVAVDTVNRAMGGGDENSSVDMGLFLANSERIKAAFPGCGVVPVHHSGKNLAAGARGHSSFVSNVGGQLLVEKDEATGIRTVCVDKMRDGDDEGSFSFELKVVELGKDKRGKVITSCVVVPSIAPAASDSSSPSTLYGWIYEWWRDHYEEKPVSYETIRQHLTTSPEKSEYPAIRPDKEKRTTKKHMEDAWEWGKSMKLAKPDGKLWVLTVREKPKYVKNDA